MIISYVVLFIHNNLVFIESFVLIFENDFSIRKFQARSGFELLFLLGFFPIQRLWWSRMGNVYNMTQSWLIPLLLLPYII